MSKEKDILNKEKSNGFYALLTLVFHWFETSKLKAQNKLVFGLGSKFYRVLKYTKKDDYFYGFNDFFFNKYRKLKQGEKSKVLNKYTLTTICILYNILINPFVIFFYLISYLPICYFDGLKNFVKDGFWANNVRFFNWVNFIGVVIVSALHFFN